ncbi:MAG: hypothetical protein AABY41_08080 [Nitrospirota bacterium]
MVDTINKELEPNRIGNTSTTISLELSFWASVHGLHRMGKAKIKKQHLRW